MYQFGTFGGEVSWAYAASFDGSVVVGSAETITGFNRAFRWTQDSGMQSLGTLPGAIRSVARGVSLAGNVVVGWSGYSNQIHHAFRWENGQMTDIHNPAFGQSEALGVSGDGNVVVGAWGPVSFVPARAFRWSDSMGMVDLGTLGGEWSEAWSANLDGSIVVGWAERSQGNWGAFRWTESAGLEDLNVVYAELLSPGSVLREAFAVSSDGRYIAGRGYNAVSGHDEAFLLDTQATGLFEGTAGFQSIPFHIVPNPFHRVTTVTYEVPIESSVMVAVYDRGGRVVRELIRSRLKPGGYSLSWDGRDGQGRSVAQGVYFLRLAVGSQRLETKVVLLR